jgi:hypothetical protein
MIESSKIRNRTTSDNEDSYENGNKIIVLNKKDEAKYNLK